LGAPFLTVPAGAGRGFSVRAVEEADGPGRGVEDADGTGIGGIGERVPEALGLSVREARCQLNFGRADWNEGGDVRRATHDDDLVSAKGGFDKLVEVCFRFLDCNGAHENEITAI
jgi:hypothetical protein